MRGNLTFKTDIKRRKARVLQFLGRSIGYHFLCKKVKQIWKPKGEIDIIDLGYSFFLVKFTLDEDIDTVLNEGYPRSLSHCP